jgi:uncharacterized protein YcbX
MPTLSGLFLYPVKSLRGCAVSSAELDAQGISGDRRFLVVDPDGKFLTQRTLPRLALIGTELQAELLRLSAPEAGVLTVRRDPDPSAPRRSVTIWGSSGLQAEDCGEEAALWLTAVLQAPCRLVRAGPDLHRPFSKPGKARPGDEVAFTDAYPLLIVGEASLGELNDRLAERGAEPVPMDRFRPNLVVNGTRAFAEDDWERLQIGDVVLRRGGPCARCVVINTDQAERGEEPLRTLATFRRDPTESSQVNFGQNLLLETRRGTLRAGAEVMVLG